MKRKSLLSIILLQVILLQVILLPVILLAPAGAAPAQEKGQAALGSLVEAERDFCKAAVAKGIREAFIAYLADDSTLFRPYAVSGKKWMIEQPARPGLLTWEPIFADVSSAGDLGYTTGPWEFRKNGPDDKEVSHGNYVTIWKKQRDSTWKAVVDFGISNPPPATRPAGFESPAILSEDAIRNKRVDTESERASLISLDRKFSQSSAAVGTIKAYDSFMSNEARVYRDNQFPLIGKQAARATLLAQRGILTWRPAKADVSSAGDLGYTFGVAELKAPGSDKIEYSNYVRIWKRQAGAWKVVLEVMNPAPAPTAGSN